MGCDEAAVHPAVFSESANSPKSAILWPDLKHREGEEDETMTTRYLGDAPRLGKTTGAGMKTASRAFFVFVGSFVITVGIVACSGAPTTAPSHDGLVADMGLDGHAPDLGTLAEAGGETAPSNDSGIAGPWIGPKGGEVGLLRFAVYGDVRPHSKDDDSGYPVQTVHEIFTRIAARRPQLVLGVGDWMFASNYEHAKTQLTKLLGAETPYAHQVFHAMGNHECDGWTTSNCPKGNETGLVRAYFEKLLPFTKKAYFKLDVKTQVGKAKFVIIAPNAWDSAQETWLKQAMQETTRYTFVVRHEPPTDMRAPGMKPSEAIFKNYPHTTLFLYGHDHEYRHLSANQVISGNGGAPMHDGSHYGYLWVEQLSDGNIKVSARRSDSDQVTDSFTLTPEGQLKP